MDLPNNSGITATLAEQYKNHWRVFMWKPTAYILAVHKITEIPQFPQAGKHVRFKFVPQ